MAASRADSAASNLGEMPFAVRIGVPIILGAVIIALWEFVVYHWKIPKFIFPSPSMIVHALINIFWFTGILPPLPIALARSGVYNLVKHVGDDYIGLAEPAPWYGSFAPPMVHVAVLTGAVAGIMSSISTFWALPASILSGSAAAAGLAWINSVGNLGGYVSPKVVGAIRDHTHNPVYPALLLAASCLVWLDR